MKLRAEIGEETHEIELANDGEKVVAVVGDRRYELEVSEPEPNVLLIRHEGRIYEASVSAPSDRIGPAHVRIGPGEFEINLIDPKRLRGSGADDAQSDGIAEIRTAMPGKVVRLLCGPGSEVAKGDGVLVVEAMKMQNELRSPKAGVVKEIRVAEGATVSSGDVLATIE